MSRTRSDPSGAVLRRLTRQIGHIVTQSGATARSWPTRLAATAAARAGNSASAGPPQHQVCLRLLSGSRTVRPAAASSWRGASITFSALA